MKGIILAGGTGSRLWPVTKSVSKQLLPIYDKPMIYYPLSTLMLAGVRDILMITTQKDQPLFKDLLGNGENFGINLSYQIQVAPNGLAEAFIIAEDFLNGESALMVLGDNIFHGNGLGQELSKAIPQSGGHIFTYKVANPSDYGILEIDLEGNPVSVTEKPQNYVSNLAITGLYFFDSEVVAIAKKVLPSHRGELEITSIIEHYLQNGNLSYTMLSRGTAWLDTGNPNSLNDAGAYIRIIEERTGLKIACPEEIGYQNGWLDKNQLKFAIDSLGKNEYRVYLEKILNDIF
jgi:glucose-1-phosphate thymidylyltransferase